MPWPEATALPDQEPRASGLGLTAAARENPGKGGGDAHLTSLVPGSKSNPQTRRKEDLRAFPQRPTKSLILASI